MARAELADMLRHSGGIPEPVVDAFAAIPREAFLAEFVAEHGVDAVYEDVAIVTRTGAGGMPTSSSSQPSLMARMLAALDVVAGDHVLEVGAGTGYNAALLERLVGPDGSVTTIDVDAEITTAATEALDGLGSRVRVELGDGRDGLPRDAPYDRIVVTGAAATIPNAWITQLRPGGRIVLPLEWETASGQLVAAFARDGDALRSDAILGGGFMALHGGEPRLGPPPGDSLQASRFGTRHDDFGSLRGAAVGRLSSAAAGRVLRRLIAGPDTTTSTALRHDRSIDTLAYLACLGSRLPVAERVCARRDGAWGVGLVAHDGSGLGLVTATDGRVTLEAYGDREPLDRLEQVIAGAAPDPQLVATPGAGHDAEVELVWPAVSARA